MSRQDQQARAASNQSFFREVNEQVETLAPATAAFVEFICESARQECAELVSLTMEECEDVRRESNRFFVLPGHEVRAVEVVVASSDRYVVVSKIGKGAVVAESLDPRRNSAETT